MVPVTDRGTATMPCRVGGVLNANEADVILILSAASATQFAHTHFLDDQMLGPDPIKLARFEAFLADDSSPAVRMPVIFSKSNLGIIFEGGRHRTTVLAGRHSTVPILTKESLAIALQAHWGSKSIAQKEYDFSQCKIAHFVGHP